MICAKPKFWAFLRETRPGLILNGTEECAGYVRGYCNVQSRSEIRPGTVAEQRWNLIESAYRAWDMAPRAGAA